MKVEMWSIDKVIPYARNPRKNDAAVPKVMASLKEYGFRQPIVVDKEGVVIVGHTRLKAAQQLGMNEVPVHIATGLTASQVKAYRIADNRTSEEAEWDQELLGLELSDLREADFDLNLTGFDGDTIEQALNPDEPATSDGTYTRKVEAPAYQITGEKPDITALYDKSRYDQLVREINSSSMTDEQKQFLLLAATRHIVFDYQNIAEFYAHSDASMQKLMEDSALIIIDFNRAIELGFVRLSDQVKEQYSKDNSGVSDE
jgi:ParB-like chromosome segregation protein Spo0J